MKGNSTAAMATPLPPALKSIKPFMKRAQEIEGSQKKEALVVAYYCKSYALQKALELGVNSEPGVAEYLGSVMDGLEAAKVELGVTKAEGKEIVRNFSLGVFKKADDEYRAGLANKGTARSFYAAGSFLEVNRFFKGKDEGEDHEIDNLRKYAKLKATEIILALKQGKKPLPPELVEEEKELKKEQEEEEEEEQEEVVQPKKEGETKQKQSGPKVVQEIPTHTPKPVTKNANRRKTRLKPRGEQGNQQTKKAEAFGRQAIQDLQLEKYTAAANNLGEAIRALESSKPNTKVDDGNVTEKAQEDSLELAFFAVRALECIGTSVDLDEGIELAVNHFSEALTLLES